MRTFVFTIDIEDDGAPSGFRLNGGEAMPVDHVVRALGYAAGALHGIASNTIEATPMSGEHKLAMIGGFTIEHDMALASVQRKEGVTGSVMTPEPAKE